MHKIIFKFLLLALFINISQGCSIQSTNSIESTIIKLSNNLLRSSRVKPSSLENIAIVTFVNLDNFKSASVLGRILSESMLDELFTKGYNVVDFRGQHAISVDENGEYFISRNTNKIKQRILNKYLLVGTYSIINSKVLINARIIDNITGKIVASARVYYKTNDCKLTNSCKKQKTKMTNIDIVSRRKNKISAAKRIL